MDGVPTYSDAASGTAFPFSVARPYNASLFSEASGAGLSKSHPSVVSCAYRVLTVGYARATCSGQLGSGGTILTGASRCSAAHGAARPAREHEESEGAA